MDKNKYLADPDVLLMLKFKAGDKSAFEELLAKYKKPLVNFIYRLSQNEETSNDLAQEVFIKIYNAAKTYQPRSKFVTWLYTIARNLCLNELRKNKKIVVSLDEKISTQNGQLQREIPASEASSPYESIAKEELQQVIKQALESLPLNQKTAVVLRRYQLLSYEEISQTMGCSVSAVKSLLNRAKESLKEKLKYYISIK